MPDTNAWVHVIRNPTSLVKARIVARRPDEVAFCSVVRAELRRGALKSRFPTRELVIVDGLAAPHTSLPFDDAAADRHAEIWDDLERRGLRIGHYDMQIAAIALVHGLTVVTHNVGEFSRVPGLKVEDWEVP